MADHEVEAAADGDDDDDRADDLRQRTRRLASRSFAPPSVLPDISPTWGEIGRHLGFRQSLMAQEWAGR